MQIPRVRFTVMTSHQSMATEPPATVSAVVRSA
jgi:hypothetical protein